MLIYYSPYAGKIRCNALQHTLRVFNCNEMCTLRIWNFAERQIKCRSVWWGFLLTWLEQFVISPTECEDPSSALPLTIWFKSLGGLHPPGSCNHCPQIPLVPQTVLVPLHTQKRAHYPFMVMCYKLRSKEEYQFALAHFLEDCKVSAMVACAL